jgi:uncharacterized protein YegL
MKLITEDMQTGQVGNFKFSGVRPEKLGATEYTLVTIVTDKTGSILGFAGDLLEMKRAVAEACKKSPRADFLMFRSVEFNNSIDEEHGFKELAQVSAADYSVPVCGGMTALFDATWNAVAATNEYARILTDQDFGVNAVVFVITDGDDNASARTGRMVGEEMKRGVQNEWLESLNVVLVGVNAARYRAELEAFRSEAGLTQYVDIGDATPQKLAKLADFVSRSISSQSQSLGTGGPSQALTF